MPQPRLSVLCQEQTVLPASASAVERTATTVERPTLATGVSHDLPDLTTALLARRVMTPSLWTKVYALRLKFLPTMLDALDLSNDLAPADLDDVSERACLDTGLIDTVLRAAVGHVNVNI